MADTRAESEARRGVREDGEVGPTTREMIARLWNLCNVLKDDGVTYHQYLAELTYLLFLKMAAESGVENALPAEARWGHLFGTRQDDQLEAYQLALVRLANHGPYDVRSIFRNATSFVTKPVTLSTLLLEINKLDWFTAREEGFGDLYEGLLEKNALEKKSGAGQYFTPRALINSITTVMKPTPFDTIQDPAAGTGGFLISAHNYLVRSIAGHPPEQSQLHGMEHVQDTHRLAMMNFMLHGIRSDESRGVLLGDSLSEDAFQMPSPSLILTNPPFGTKKGGGLPARRDLPVATSNKQLCFLQHCMLSLSSPGRAAVVVPDNVLFDEFAGARVRNLLMETCNVHTLLRLPTGIFYAAGVKTNVIFFSRLPKEACGQDLWVYDLRTGMPAFNRRTELSNEHLEEFEAIFGDDPYGSKDALESRTDGAASGRFRRYTRADIADNGGRWDFEPVSAGRDPRASEENVEAAISKIADDLTGALRELRTLVRLLDTADLGLETDPELL